jgi:hypothetical protein
MTTQANFPSGLSYRYLYNFLLVLTEEQIFKLRNIAIGTSSLSSFSENEIRELEGKLDEKRDPSGNTRFNMSNGNR